MSTPWAHRFAQRTKFVKSSTIRELLKLTQRPEVISFAGGLPAPDVFPVERFETACHRVLESQGPMAMQYSASEGYAPRSIRGTASWWKRPPTWERCKRSTSMARNT
jgi:2-aminoadipate transaminase